MTRVFVLLPDNRVFYTLDIEIRTYKTRIDAAVGKRSKIWKNKKEEVIYYYNAKNAKEAFALAEKLTGWNYE